MGEQRTLNSPVVGSSPIISTKLGTVMEQSLYRKLEKDFEDYHKCPKCLGTGKLDDNDGFGSSYNEWDCDSCGGDGIRKIHPMSK